VRTCSGGGAAAGLRSGSLILQTNRFQARSNKKKRGRLRRAQSTGKVVVCLMLGFVVQSGSTSSDADRGCKAGDVPRHFIRTSHLGQ
jgi:hypothetical protein